MKFKKKDKIALIYGVSRQILLVKLEVCGDILFVCQRKNAGCVQRVNFTLPFGLYRVCMRHFQKKQQTVCWFWNIFPSDWLMISLGSVLFSPETENQNPRDYEYCRAHKSNKQSIKSHMKWQIHDSSMWWLLNSCKLRKYLWCTMICTNQAASVCKIIVHRFNKDTNYVLWRRK